MSKGSDSTLLNEYYNIGNAFYDLGKFEKAKEYYEKVLALDKDFHKARYNLIYVNMYNSNFADANLNIDYLISADSMNYKIKEFYAYIKYKEKDYESALSIYSELLDRGFVSNDLYLNISKIYFILNEFQKSLSFIDKVLVDSEDPEYFYMAGLISEKSDMFSKAKNYYEVSLELGNNSIDLLKSLHVIYSDQQDLLNDVRILELIASIGKDEDKSNALFELSKIYFLKNNNFPKGYSYLESAISAGFKDSEKATDLMKEPDLLDLEKIRKLFLESKIIK